MIDKNKKEKVVITLNKERIKCIFKLLQKYDLAGKNLFITDKLFLELIGHGNIRKKIMNDHKSIIQAKRSKLSSKIQLKTELQEYIVFLECFFDSKIREKLPHNHVYPITLAYCKACPFIDLFYCFEQQIIDYAKNLHNSCTRYNEFISVLVTDSIVRCLLMDPYLDCDFFEIRLRLLLKKYRNDLYPNLLLIATAYKKDIEKKRKIKGIKQLLRFKDDFADAEPAEFVFFGKEIDGLHYPITFLTFENLETLKARFAFYFVGSVTLRCNKQNSRNKLCLGRAIIADLENLKHHEIYVETYLNYYTPSSYTLPPGYTIPADSHAV